MKNNVGRKRLKIVIVVSFLVIAAMGTTFYKVNLKSKELKKAKENIMNNRAILKKLEETNVAEVEKKLSKDQDKNQSKDEISTDKEDKKQDSSKNVSGESNKLYFEDSVFMGDSLTEPLDFYNILNKSSVLAKKGQSVIDAKKAASGLENLNPKRVFLLYGLNDLDMFENVSDFKRNYGELVDNVKKNAPNADVYVQSVMPVQKKVQNGNKNYSEERSQKFLQAVQDIAKEKKVNYVDIRPVIKDKEYLFEPDGMHFTAKFYDFWLDYLKEYLDNPPKYAEGKGKK